jgi:hypothetical protein
MTVHTRYSPIRWPTCAIIRLPAVGNKIIGMLSCDSNLAPTASSIWPRAVTRLCRRVARDTVSIRLHSLPRSLVSLRCPRVQLPVFAQPGTAPIRSRVHEWGIRSTSAGQGRDNEEPCCRQNRCRIPRWPRWFSWWSRPLGLSSSPHSA